MKDILLKGNGARLFSITCAVCAYVYIGIELGWGISIAVFFLSWATIIQTVDSVISILIKEGMKP